MVNFMCQLGWAMVSRYVIKHYSECVCVCKGVFVFVFLYNFLFVLFIYFGLHWVFVAVRGLSLVVVSKGYSSLWCVGFSLRWLLLLWSTGSRHMGFSSCVMQAQQLWHTGLVAPQHVGSSQTRAQTHVPCISRRILNHCAGFSSCSMRAQELWHKGLVALRHVGSSRTRAQTHVPCISRRILNHCATREVPITTILRLVRVCRSVMQVVRFWIISLTVQM